MKQIALNLCGSQNVEYQSWPVTQGIPFADGDFQSDTPARVVTDAGQVLPTQTQVLATWDRDRKYVKWLLVDYQADRSARGAQKLFLEYGSDAQAPEHPNPIRLSDEGGRLTVDTGPLRLKLLKPFPHPHIHCVPEFFADADVRTRTGWRNVFRTGDKPFLYLRDQHGNQYTSRHSPAARVVVEEAGPLRVCIRVNGYHASPDGRPLCPFIIRLHLYAGKSDLAIHHTFVFDQDPHRLELSAVGMKFPLDLGSVPSDTVQHLQVSDRQFQVLRNGAAASTGSRGSGWTALNGSDASALAVLRNFWQEYPKGLETSPEGIDVGIWPQSFEKNLSFTTPFEAPAIFFKGTRDETEVRRLLDERPTAPLNLKSFNINTEEDLLWVESMIEKYAPGRCRTP